MFITIIPIDSGYELHFLVSPHGLWLSYKGLGGHGNDCRLWSRFLKGKKKFEMSHISNDTHRVLSSFLSALQNCLFPTSIRKGRLVLENHLNRPLKLEMDQTHSIRNLTLAGTGHICLLKSHWGETESAVAKAFLYSVLPTQVRNLHKFVCSWTFLKEICMVGRFVFIRFITANLPEQSRCIECDWLC